MPDRTRVFPALLNYWRRRRGMSQLDLALAAEISSRHVSFLETGRSRPSHGMILLLGSVLDMPLREQNVMLREEGHPPAYPEPPLDGLADPVVERTLDLLLRTHEPFPVMILDRGYSVLRLNRAAEKMVTFTLGGVPEGLNIVRAFFDPNGFKPFILDWDTIAREAIARLHREALRTPNNDGLAALRDEVLAMPGVPDTWREPDFSRGTEGALAVRFLAGGQTFSFLTMLTVFQAPQNVTLEELQIETYLPADDETEQACRSMLS